MIQLFLLFCAIFTLPTAHASEVSQQTLLRKLSLHLKGYPPAPEEYAELAAVKSDGDFATLWNRKIKEYQAAPEYHGKMVDRLYDLFLLRKPAVLQELIAQDEEQLAAMSPDARKSLRELPYGSGAKSFLLSESNTRNSLDFLFQSLTKSNASWLSLLDSPKYEIQLDGGGSPDDYVFFSKVDSCALDPALPSSLRDLLTAKYAAKEASYNYYSPSSSDPLNAYYGQRGDFSCGAEDPRVGGAITTARFLRRYSRSAANKNFKRAAAVFRIFLCDDMQPAIKAESDQDELARQKQRFAPLGARQSPTPESPVSSDPIDLPMNHSEMENIRHASQASCRSCHYKLDPVASVFSAIGQSLSDSASAGAIAFTDSKQQLRNIPVSGIGDLGKKLAGLQDVKECQTRRFWDWFVGVDVPLSTERLRALLAQLDSVGFRTNDVVAAMVNLPEFSKSKQVAPAMPLLSKDERVVRYESVRPFLQRCTDCHAKPGVDGPSLENIQVKDISRVLDIAGQGANASMPPKGPWPDQKLLNESVRAWICAGAPSAQGEVTIDLLSWNPGYCQEVSK